MPIYHTLGKIPPRRHIAHPREGGGIHHEQLVGNKGFAGASSLLYHLRRPTSVCAVEHLEDRTLRADPDPALRHRHLRTARLAAGGSPTLGRVPLLFNSQLTILCASPDSADEHFFRNGQADEYVFFHEGAGVLESQFGELPFSAGDQLIIPRGILHRYRLDGAARMLVVESRGELRWPRRYHNDQGQLLEGAPFCERSVRRPGQLVTEDQKGRFAVVVKQRDQLTRLILDHHPLDVVGWDGYYYPWAISIHDFEPITGTIHQPPPIHQLLQSDGLVLCNFCPRPFDFHPLAVPAPYHHSNVMTDEVLYYANDTFMSRKGVEAGSITLHPDGLPHGPQPGRYSSSVGQQQTEELAVMVDAFRPLQATRQALQIDDADYPLSWLSE